MQKMSTGDRGHGNEGRGLKEMGVVQDRPDVRFLNSFDCDPDFRRNPKTKFFCWRCQKDLKLSQAVRYAYFVADWQLIVHPEDVIKYGSGPNDGEWCPLGMDCAKIVGLTWTVSEIPPQKPEAHQ